MAVRRLNHAVLYVRDLASSVDFYTDTLSASRSPWRVPGRAAFLRAKGTANDHDLGLFAVPDGQLPDGRYLGLYHLAWEVGTLAELAEVRERLAARQRARRRQRPPSIKVAVRQGPERHRVRGHVARAGRGLGRGDGLRRHDPAARPGGGDRPLGRPGHRRRSRLGHLIGSAAARSTARSRTAAQRARCTTRDRRRRPADGDRTAAFSKRAKQAIRLCRRLWHRQSLEAGCWLAGVQPSIVARRQRGSERWLAWPTLRWSDRPRSRCPAWLAEILAAWC